MTTFVSGRGGTLVAQFFQFAGGGPLVDLDSNPTLTVTDLASSAIVLGPIAVGVIHSAQGTYTYPWTMPIPASEYQVVWNGTVSANPVQAVELFGVTTDSPNSDGPCAPWPAIWCGTISPSVAAVTGTYVEIATEVLWAKSGRQFGMCSLTLRPCRRDCWGGAWPFADRWNEWGASWPYPYWFNGQWFNMGCGGCPGSCSCTVLHEVVLPAPVAQIDEVKVDGVTLAPSAYRLYDHRTLLRVDGGMWPICNDLNKDDTEVGTWSVTATYGTDVPALGQLAVGELAEQLALACVEDGQCKLPSPVQQLVRQGVTLTFLDPSQVFADGKIGLYTSDLFISTYNPQGIAARAQVIDVDGPRARRLT